MVLLGGDVMIVLDKKVANGGGYRLQIKWRIDKTRAGSQFVEYALPLSVSAGHGFIRGEVKICCDK